MHGEGDFIFGYFGGVTLARARRAGVENTTGLLWRKKTLYDPGTGCFLYCDIRLNQTNPYVPSPHQGAAQSRDPAGMLGFIWKDKNNFALFLPNSLQIRIVQVGAACFGKIDPVSIDFYPHHVGGVIGGGGAVVIKQVGSYGINIGWDA